MRRIFFLISLVIIFSGCKDNIKISIKGVIKGEKQKYIYLNRLDVNTAVVIDSSKINRKGEFRFRIKSSEPDFYQVGYSNSDFITLLAEPGEDINIVFEDNTLYNNYSISGSPGSEKIRILDGNLAETIKKLDSLSSVFAKASTEPGFEKKQPEYEEQFASILKSQRRKNIEFIINNMNSLAALKAIYQKINPDTYVLYDPKDLQYMKIVNDSLSLHYPNSKHVQALSRDFSKEMNRMYTNQLEEMARNLPETKLDPNLKNMDGKRIALSSLRGKVVLLAFWSVQSKECIEENLQFKELYKTYKKDGFEIYQINLDEKESDWKKAVKFDELPWISTREDDPKDPVNARIFNVRTLPANYLFDRKGNIVGNNLHGRALQIKLAQMFNKD